MPPSRPMPSAQPTPVERIRAGYSAATMALAPSWLPIIAAPAPRIGIAMKGAGRLSRPTARMKITPDAKLQASTCGAPKRSIIGPSSRRTEDAAKLEHAGVEHGGFRLESGER